MNGSHIWCSILWLLCSAAAAQQAAPREAPSSEVTSSEVAWNEALQAEEAERWDEALQIYRSALEEKPDQPSLWLRVADIEARLEHAQAAAGATLQAALQEPLDASIQYRLARAYSVAERPELALQAAEKALELEPDNIEFLRGRAQLANWIGRYDLARDSYQRILKVSTSDSSAILGLARVEAWSGELDEAARFYRRYTERYPDDGASLLEYARTETWRGNFPTSIAVLENYREILGQTEDYLDDKARVLVAAQRPNAALEILDPRLENDPASLDLTANYTLALASSGRPEQALDSLETLIDLDASHPKTEEVFRIVQTPLRSTVGPMMDIYHDSDSVEKTQFDVDGGVSLSPRSRLQAGLYSGELRADAGSGLEPLGGKTMLNYSGLWVGLSQRLTPRFSFEGRVGEAEDDDGDHLLTYRLAATFELSDALDLTLGRQRDYYLVSPRAFDLGIDNTSHQLQLSWRPDLRHQLDLSAAYDSLSDDNDRWELALAPRRAFLRREHFNLDLGLRAWWFRFDQDLNNGYYDPSRYQSYAVNSFGYWKIADDHGLSFVLSLGVFKDDTMADFRFGGSAAVELTLGFYRDWMLRMRAGFTDNSRVGSGAFQAYGGGIFLTRRLSNRSWRSSRRPTPPSDRRPIPKSLDALTDSALHFARTHSPTARPNPPATQDPPSQPTMATASPAREVDLRPDLNESSGTTALEALVEPTDSTAVSTSNTLRQGSQSQRIFELQLGLFHHEKNARHFADNFNQRGHRPYIVEVKSSLGETRYTVRLGPYASMSAAQAMGAELHYGESLATVIRYRSLPRAVSDLTSQRRSETSPPDVAAVHQQDL